MPVINDRQSLAARRQAAQAKRRAVSQGKTLINVSCGTCGLASGAELALEAMRQEVKSLQLADVEFVRSGCMTYCFAEPTVTITRPDMAPVTFGKVDENRARDLVREFILKGVPVAGEIAVTYERVVLSE